jgi:hypothetical protein
MVRCVAGVDSVRLNSGFFGWFSIVSDVWRVAFGFAVIEADFSQLRRGY